VPSNPVRPQPDELSAPFWAGAAEHRLRLQRCLDCRHINHPPQALCGWCTSRRLEFEDVAGTGHVASWTSELRSGSNRGAPAHTNLVVELDVQDGVYLVSSVAGERPDWAHIGARVEAYFAPLPGLDVVVPWFGPEAAK
jgi:uncharacterized protein